MSAAPKPAMSAKPAGWLYTSPSGRTQYAAPLDEREQGLCDEGWTETPLYSANTIAALRKDAERYRLLRKRVGIIGGAVRATFCIVNLHPTYVAPDAAVELDAAIDAAQSTEGSQ